MNRKSRIRQEKIEVRKYVYRTEGKEPCPYPKGSRQAKYWHKQLKMYHECEAEFEEMALVYGEFRTLRQRPDSDDTFTMVD